VEIESMALKDKEVLIPAAKAGLSMLTSVVAEAGAGWAGILSGGALDAMDRARENLTYIPEDGSKARGYLEKAAYEMEPVGIAADQLNRKVGDTVYDATGSPMAAAAATAIPEAIMSLGGLKSLKLKPSALNPDIKPTPEMMQKVVNRSLDPFNLHKGANPTEAKMYVGGQAVGVPKRIADNTLETGQPGVGWRVGPDGEARFQISDKAATFKLEPDIALNERHGAPIANIIEHKELFKMYPELAKIKIKKTNNPRNNGHFAVKFDNKGNLTGGDIALNTAGRSDTEIMGTMLHEMQHWIQVKEKFSPGSSADKFDNLKTKVLPKKASELKELMKSYANVETMLERADGAPAIAALKARQADLMKEVQSTQEQVKILQGLKKSSDGWNYDRTLGEIEARDTTDMYNMERMGADPRQLTPAINRKRTSVGGAHEDIVIDPAKEALILPPQTSTPMVDTPMGLSNIRNL
jgi:hypothetical protein